MKNINKIKHYSFREFLKRLSKHKIGECMDIVPMNADFNLLKIPKQK